MLRQQDNLVIWILVLLIIIGVLRWLYFRFFVAVPKAKMNPNDDIVCILEKYGYIPIQRKIRVPIKITIADKEILESRYYIDAIARKDGFTYAVCVSKTRKPMEHTNTSIRDTLFPIYLLAFWDGVLFVDKEVEKVTLYTFQYDSFMLPKKKYYLNYFVFFILGIMITLLLL